MGNLQEVHVTVMTFDEFVTLGEREEYNMGAADAVSMSMFNHDRDNTYWRRQRISYLYGARKCFYQGTFHLANSSHKAAVIAMILMELGCKNVEYSVNVNTIPTCYTVKFSPTEEVKEIIE